MEMFKNLKQNLPLITGMLSILAGGVGVFIAMCNGGFIAGCFGVALSLAVVSIFLEKGQ